MTLLRCETARKLTLLHATAADNGDKLASDAAAAAAAAGGGGLFVFRLSDRTNQSDKPRFHVQWFADVVERHSWKTVTKWYVVRWDRGDINFWPNVQM